MLTEGELRAQAAAPPADVVDVDVDQPEPAAKRSRLLEMLQAQTTRGQARTNLRQAEELTARRAREPWFDSPKSRS